METITHEGAAAYKAILTVLDGLTVELDEKGNVHTEDALWEFTLRLWLRTANVPAHPEFSSTVLAALEELLNPIRIEVWRSVPAALPSDEGTRY